MIKDLLKNNILLTAGAVISLLINIITMPIITRIYTPSEIGNFAALHVFTLALFPILGMRMEIIFAQKIKSLNLKNIFFTTLIITFFLSVLSWIILFFSAKYLEQYLLLNYLSLIVSLALFLTFFENCIGIYNHLKLYKSIAIITTLGIFFQKLLQIIFGMYFNDKTLAIFLSYCIPALLLSLIMLFIINREINFFKNINFDFNLLKRYKNHILYRTSYSLSNLFKDRLIIILIITFFSSENAGLYSQSLGLLLIPATIFSMPIKTIITREYHYNKKNTIDMIVFVYKILIYLILPIYVFFFYNSSVIFPIIFGENWNGLSKVFNILSIPMFILIFSSALDRLYDVLNKQKYAFLFEALFGFLCFGGFFFMSYYNYSFIDALKVNAIILFIFFTTFTVFILKKAGQFGNFSKIIKYFIMQLIFCGLIFSNLIDNFSFSIISIMILIIFGLYFLKRDTRNLLKI